jgi:predicted lipoprotein
MQIDIEHLVGWLAGPTVLGFFVQRGFARYAKTQEENEALKTQAINTKIDTMATEVKAAIRRLEISLNEMMGKNDERFEQVEEELEALKIALTKLETLVHAKLGIEAGEKN